MKKRILSLFFSCVFIFTTCFVNYSWAAGADDTTKVVFSDENVKKEVVNCLKDPNNLFDTTKAIDKSLVASYEPTVGDMKNLKKLTVGPLFDASYKPIDATSIKGLEEAVNVVDLHLSSLHAPDINLISAMPNVEKLYLKSNDLNDLSIISNMHNLVELNISSNNISNFSGLENATKLEKLTATENQIADLSAIRNLTGLKELYLDNNKISDIGPIENLNNLEVLRLSENFIKSIDKIGSKPQLKELQINGAYTGPFDSPDQSGNVISDISKLSTMTNLETLYIQDTVLVNDLSPLSNLTKLRTLILRGNNITDVKPLANLTNLSTLYLYKNHVKDISPLANMTNMKEFNFAVNKVEDISVLRNMKNLSDVKGYLNNISDFEPLKDVNAEVVNFTNNHLVDLSFLQDIGKNGAQGFYVLDRQDKSMDAEIVSKKEQADTIEFLIKNPVRLADGSVLAIDASQKLDPALKEDFEIGDAVEINNKVIDENNAANIKIISEGDNLKISMPKTSYKSGMKVDVPFSKFGTLVSDEMPFELYGTFSGVVHFTLGESNKMQRIFGSNRIGTSIAVSKNIYEKSNYVILANKDSYADAITATPLSSALKAPILLVDKDIVVSDIYAELQRLGVKNVVVIGGTNVISSNVENQLNNKGYLVERISGRTRYDTSLEIYKKLASLGRLNGNIILASGENFPDALSASSIAVKEICPILLAKKDTLNKSIKDQIIKDGKKVIIIGGANSISENIEKVELKNKEIDRLYGDNRYETAISVAKYINPTAKSFVIASGENYPDALVASSVSLKNNIPIILTQKNDMPESVKKYINNFNELYVIGGDNAISPAQFTKNQN